MNMVVAAQVVGMTITKPLRLIFMGSPEFAVPCLQTLINSPHEVVAVYCQPPRPAGRGQKLQATPVQKIAQQHAITVHHPKSLKSVAEQKIFASYKPDIAIVAAYGLILPQAILDIPKRGCINVHPSALPRWRGAAPLQRTIMAGDEETQLCIMQMQAGLDTGPILTRQTFPLDDGTTAGQLHDIMAYSAGDAVLAAIHKNPTPIAQTKDGVTYAAKIDKAEAQIDWTKSATQIRQHILGLSPFPGAFSIYQGEVIKILNAELATDQGAAGTLLDDNLLVACGQHALRITHLQRAGKKPMTTEELLRGFTMPKGTAFNAAL